MKPIRVTIWNEYRDELRNEDVGKVYPEGIHKAIKGAFFEPLIASEVSDFVVQTATLDDEEHGLGKKILDHTDVLIWWSHSAHDEVPDEAVDRIQTRIQGGMGFIALHSSMGSKIFKRLMGTSCRVRWREADEKVRIFSLRPDHPITQGIPECFELPEEEMYGERFGIPDPDELIFLQWFQGGDVFRGGCCFRREKGKIFYFQPGHETYPQYYNPIIRRIIVNAARWAAPLAPIFPEVVSVNAPNATPSAGT